MQLQITNINYSRIIVVFVKNRLFIYTYLLIVPNYVNSILFRCRHFSEFRPPLQKLGIKLRKVWVISDIIIAFKEKKNLHRVLEDVKGTFSEIHHYYQIGVLTMRD